MIIPRPPRTEPAIDGRILTWAREVQQSLRDITTALASLPTPTTRRSQSPQAVEQAPSHPWKIFASPYTGTGSPPANQALRVRVKPGLVNNLLPTNIEEEFLLPESSATYLYLVVNISTDSSGFGQITGVTIATGSEIPPEQDTANPSTSYLGIAQIITGETSVTDIYQLLNVSVWGGFEVVYWTCNTQIRQWKWNIPSSFDF